MKNIYPFSAIVGQDLMKKALILNVIDPSIGGVLIRGEKGTAKSTAVRALAATLPEIKVVKGCKFFCDPDDKLNLCEICKSQIEKNEPIDVEYRKMKVINLPVGSTEDRVVGTLDIEKVLKEGIKSFEPGILAEANRGILYIDEVNLLSDHIVDIILDAAAMGKNYIEREGISFSHPSRFILIGTMNPEEGDLRPQLLDRFGLCVEIKGIKNVENRVEVIKRRKEFEKNPDKFIRKWSKLDNQLKKKIITAQKNLKKVKINDLMLKIIAQISIDLNVDGHRADIIMEKTAKAISAFYGEKEVSEQHIREATKFVLPHRMRKNPFEELNVEYDIVEESIQKIKSSSKNEISKKMEFIEKKKVKNENHKKESSNIKGTIYSINTPFKIKKFNFLKKSKISSTSGRRVSGISNIKQGRVVGYKDSTGKIFDIAILPTIKFSAIKYGKDFKITKNTIKENIRLNEQSTYILFVVDSSGSMGVEKQMIQVKTLIYSLLIDAYQKRDKVGMVVFRATEAKLILPFTNSVHVAKKKLEKLETGGKTPLAHGLKLAFQVFKQEKNKNPDGYFIMILVSDGRGNVPLNGKNSLDQSEVYGLYIKKLGVKTLVLDTEVDHLAFGYSWELARLMKGKYMKLDSLNAENIQNIVFSL